MPDRRARVDRRCLGRCGLNEATGDRTLSPIATLAARFADELNVVFLSPEQIAESLPLIHARCEEIGRDPAPLRLSVYASDDEMREPGQARVDLIGRYSHVGLARLVVSSDGSATT